MKVGVGLLAVCFAVGCGASSTPKTDVTPPPVAETPAPSDPAQALQEQFRSAAFQVDAATGAIEEALAKVRPMLQGNPPETKEAVQNVLDGLDSAAATIGEFNEAPKIEEVRAHVSTYDERRLKMIDELNDAWRELGDAGGTLEDLLASDPPANVKASLEAGRDAVDDASDALEEAIQALGGKVIDEPAEAPSTKNP